MVSTNPLAALGVTPDQAGLTAHQNALSPVTATLAAAVQRRGVGLHSGVVTTVTLRPAPAQTGRVFIRQDLPGQPHIPAQLAAVDQTLLSTELRRGEATVRTVEHLLAALVGLGVDHLYIDLDGPEVPLLDGSALGWVEAIREAGLAIQGEPIAPLTLAQPITLQQGDAWIAAFPAAAPRLTYGIDFEVAAIGHQWFSWQPTADPLAPEGFAEAIAPARTFGLAHQIEALQRQGLIQGGSLENALVCSHEGWVNPPLRFEQEPVRHKLLDLVGDLGLLGRLPQAHVVAYKASHRLHVALAKAIQSSALECPLGAV
ncbi:UDP-3-O-acyl-N-acetylglucosamine deacetylase [Phormidium sp. FACHB-1136]|uniref:UDP-3-O-acyl-N-acetylglucosamine deacetylase n=1 Tax=Phormidium sp. FACHB-1136 TaxID=2692848 RepID=UPI001682B2EF|nr:UDP-3-O-acyl-N-acetylglucosamine deacetylase [Phormidium sp. FACHB-1136]MBD2425956.1 UDP-3-O-acyl-N-acetylglucosamine deacetylase [Phormidium sp. FACHB-1136]